MCDRICKVCGGDDAVATIAEAMGFRPDVAFMNIRKLELLLMAVTVSSVGGIICNDVNGTNWFDARDILLKTNRS